LQEAVEQPRFEEWLTLAEHDTGALGAQGA
jgi:hypothetical protein